MKPWIDAGQAVHLVDVDASTQRFGEVSQPLGPGVPELAADAIERLTVTAAGCDVVEAGKPRLEAAQRLLQRFLKGPADRHRFTHGLHLGRQPGVGLRELLEVESGGSW